MLLDEIKEAAEYGEVMKDTTGKCKYCRQFLAIRIPITWTENDCDEVATEKCNCSGSKRYVTHKKRVETLDKSLEKMFGSESRRDVEPDTVDLIRSMALAVIAGNIEKVTIDIPSKKMNEPSERLKIHLKKELLYIGIEKKVTNATII